MSHSTSAPSISNRPVLLSLGIATLCFVIHLVITLVILVLAFIVHMYEDIYFKLGDIMQADIALPAITVLLLRYSNLIRRIGWLLFIAFFLIDGALAFGLQFLPISWRWLKTVWFIGYLLAAIFFLFFTIVALTIPLVNALENVEMEQ